LLVAVGAAGRLNLATAIPAPVSGYLGTLLQYAQIDLDRQNISNLQAFIRYFQALKEGGDVSQLQIDQVEQQLLQGRLPLLTDKHKPLAPPDGFNPQLALPTTLPRELDDSPPQPLNRQFRRYDDVLREYEDITTQAAQFGRPEDAAKLRGEL